MSEAEAIRKGYRAAKGSGTFDVLCAGAGGDPGEAIDFRWAFRSKRDPVLIRHVAG